MARLDDQRRALAMNVRASRAAENELTPTQARLFVRSLQTSWQVPAIAWAARESHEQFEDARRLLHAASILREIDGEGTSESLGCYRRAGELLEWLARSSDPVTRDVPVALLAAGAYQLAGLPAMATSLLRQGGYGGGTAEIFAAFLSVDFDRLLALVAIFWRDHPDLTGRQGSAILLHGAGDDLQDDEPQEERGDLADERLDRGGPAHQPAISRIGRYVVVELVRALGLIGDSVRRGNSQRLTQAIEKLADLSLLATRLASDELWMLINLIEATARRFAANSLHGRVAQLADRAPAFGPRLWRFAREQFARGRGILWASQVRGLERLIATSSFALSTPTGSGKTLVANLALVKELLLVEPDLGAAPLALYLVPSRALAGEVEAKLTVELGGDLVVTGLYGGADWGITDYWLTADRPVVLIATVEKAEALMRYVGHLLLTRLKLLIVDEAHQVVSEGDVSATEALAAHSSRSMRLEAMVSRLLAVKPQMARIALTAVAGGAAGPVAQWIEGVPDAAPVGLGYRSSRQLIGALRVDPRHPPQALLDIMNGQMLYVRGRDAPVYLPLRIPVMPQPSAVIRNSLPHYTQLYVLWTALHLLEGGRRVLISVAQSPELLMKRYAEAFALPGWNAVQPFVVPEAPHDRALFEAARAVCRDFCGQDSFELRLLERGVATSHGQMPQRLRRLMTDLIDRRICPITLATATLTEGVNLPFDMIFVTSLERRSFDAVTGQPIVMPMSAAEFRNLAGRAGRPGAAESIEGMTLVAVPESVSTTAPAQRNEQLRQVLRSAGHYDDLLRRLQAEEAATEVRSPLVVLLRSIWQKAAEQLGLQTEEQFHAWLEATLPEAAGTNLGIGSRVPADLLGDSLDELDGFLLSATEELARVEAVPPDGARTEAFLVNLWQRTFARVVAANEAWLERSFIKRGRAFVERLYPDAQLRRRLYQYGFTPYIGRRFELVAPALLADLQAAADYGGWDAQRRFDLVTQLGERIRAEPGIGFRARNTVGDKAVLEDWQRVTGWWMQSGAAMPPGAEQLRSWQRFVTENLEFRLGVAVGAAVSQAWGRNAGIETPTLETWRAISGLPWIGFWFRELLRWGTLDPFVAFALGQGLARTRDEAMRRRGEFEGWLRAEGVGLEPETLIDPRRFLAWQRSLEAHAAAAENVQRSPAHLTTADGRRASYDVRPIVLADSIRWIDAAGYFVAQSPASRELLTDRPERHDFRVTALPNVEVLRTY
ncbi:DNA helicase [Burkholderia cenocepacia]|nr:DNA helicase [Burkholderia cenocepacia]